MHAGDISGIPGVLRAMTPEQREAEKASVARMVKLIRHAVKRKQHPWGEWGEPPTYQQRYAAAAMAMAFGHIKAAMELYWHVSTLAAWAVEFKPPGVDELVEAILKEGPHVIEDVQQLISAGLATRPTSEVYIAGLMLLFRGEQNQSRGIERPFKADPGLKGTLLQILDIEGTSGANLASLENHLGEWRWSNVLLQLNALGFYSRAELLDRTIGAFERDLKESRSNWLRAFHHKLAPTIPEMSPHCSRYLALCESRMPTAVTLALEVVMQLDEAGLIAPDQLLGALRRVLSSAVKKHVEAALKLLDRSVKRQPALATQAAAVIVPALAHESSDVQKQVLRRLGQWGMDEGTRCVLAKYDNAVSPMHRDELRRLGGQAAPVTAPVDVVVSRPVARIGPLDPARRILPIASIEELVDRMSYVFEHSFELDEWERVLAALVQAAPLSEEACRRIEPVAARLPRLQTPLAHEIGRVLLLLLKSDRLRASPMTGPWGSILADQHLIRRIEDAMNLAKRCKGLVPLTTPTHMRGFIDPRVFVERVRTHIDAGVNDSVHEQASALLRLAPVVDEQALEAARALPESEFTLALRYALGDKMSRLDESALFAAAARIRRALHGNAPRRHEWYLRGVEGEEVTEDIGRVTLRRVETVPEPIRDPVEALEMENDKLDRRGWFDRPTIGGRDEGFILYHSTLVPSDLDFFFGDGATEVAQGQRFSLRQNLPYLQLLLDPTVEMTPIATLLLAAGLVSPSAAEMAVAVDVLVGTHREGRLNVSLLAKSFPPLLKVFSQDITRHAKAFREARRIDAAVSPVVFELIVGLLEIKPEKPPKGTNALLELAVEIATEDAAALTEQSRQTVTKLVLGGKGATLRKALLSK